MAQKTYTVIASLLDLYFNKLYIKLYLHIAYAVREEATVFSKQLYHSSMCAYKINDQENIALLPCMDKFRLHFR